MHFKKAVKNIILKLVLFVFPIIANAWDEWDAWDEWEKKGYHAIPIQYYYPIPATSTLKNDLWKKESEMKGVDLNPEGQLDFLRIFQEFMTEYNFPEKRTATNEFYLLNGFFMSFDAEVLHCMIRHFQPKRIIEVGSGFSTLISSRATQLNLRENGVHCELVAIEPFPGETLKKGVPGLSRLIQKKVEDIDTNFFSSLEKNDILFIDSSHVSRIGGDVNHIYLEVIPRLNKGVVVHIHDVFWPFEYPKHWVFKRHWFFTEQYMLRCFMEFNSEFEVLWASNYMLTNYRERIIQTFPSYEPSYAWHSPASSLWIRRKP